MSFLLTPCEVAVKCVLPVVRAMLSGTLIRKYKLSQLEVAKLLGISQPAVSLYGKKLRGTAIELKDDEVKNLIEDLAKDLTEGKNTQKSFAISVCRICRTIRSKGLMCSLHKALDETIDPETCGLCKDQLSECFSLKN